MRAVLLMVVLSLAVGTAACRSAPEGEGQRLERITLGPREARRPVGEAQHFTATGHYAGGATRNLTQRVEYASSDAAIARAANTPGNRSRIEAVAPGVATITATDPKSGVSSRASGDDATFRVLGALERIVLAPSTMRRKVGQTHHLTATGHYAGGAVRNLTQHVVYRSSDPTIVAAPNRDGEKSRVEMRAAGAATISAVDPATGVDSSTGGGNVTIDVAGR